MAIRPLSRRPKPPLASWTAHAHSGADTVVLMVASMPGPAPAELAAAACKAIEALIGRDRIVRIEPDGEHTVVATLATGGELAHRLTDPVLPQVLEAEMAAALGRTDASTAVAITSAGRPVSWQSRAEELWRGRLADLRDEAVHQAENGAFRRELAQLLEKGAIRTVFQPIVNGGDGGVIGYEALSRGPAGHKWERPDVLLEVAERAGLSSMVQWEMVKRARARAADELDYPRHLLFLNAPDSRFWPEARNNVGDDGGRLWPWDHIVSEVSERKPILNQPEVWAAHDRGRQRGTRYALDDVGAGYAGLAALAMLGPDFVKIDMGIVRACNDDPAKQAVVDALVQYARRSGALTVAEGIETPDEADVLRGLGVSLMQGFLLGKPSEHIQ